MKNNTKLLSLLMLLSWLAAVLAFYFVAEGTVINLQYGLSGEVNRKTTSPFAMFLIPAAISLVQLLVYGARRIEPRRNNLQHSQTALNNVLLSVYLVLLVIQGMMIAQVFKGIVLAPNMTMTLVGIVFIILGNYLPKTKPNHSIGIRTPWTLKDEQVWRKTHRFSGPLFMLSGVLLLIVSQIESPYQGTIYYTIVGVTLLISLLASVFYWRRNH